MKKIISLILCITLFSPLLLISANADTAITKTEAANLITAMYKFKEHSIKTDDGYVFLGNLPYTPITDKTVFKRLCDVLNYHQYTIDLFSLLDG